ncbi:uncharacterized protein TNCV_4559151 [Trichonephila clavipes]|nr:uncharacterized protein TNCV_4559151 [Trichonephila clavipes]
MQHQLFGGGGETSCQLHDVYELLICSLDESYSLCVELFSERKICGKVPKVSSPVVINELNRRGVILSDLANEDCEIDILLGTNVAGLLFMGGSVELDSGLFLLKTRLGFVLTGKQGVFGKRNEECDTVLNVISLLVKELSVNELWNHESIGIFYPIQKLNEKKNEQLKVMEEFKNNEGEEIVYRHCRVVFSVSSSPFLLAAVLPHLLENVPADDSQLCSKLKLSLPNTSQGVKVALVSAKAKVAPLKQAIIPRLELMACCIGANEWCHVPGKINPTDLISRGCSSSYLVESHWWEGPLWLVESPDAWPITTKK